MEILQEPVISHSGPETQQAPGPRNGVPENMIATHITSPRRDCRVFPVRESSSRHESRHRVAMSEWTPTRLEEAAG